MIILAAGNSSRLGEPKQLLIFNGKTLIRRLTEEARAVPDTTIIVVTGAEDEKIRLELAGMPVTFTFNPAWQVGMGSSIGAGIDALLTIKPDVEGALLAVSDQPFVTRVHLQELIQKAAGSADQIFASSYAGTLGTPVYFPKVFFPNLTRITGPAGAKKLLQQFPDKVQHIVFEEGAIDIDTQEDYEQLLQMQVRKP